MSGLLARIPRRRGTAAPADPSEPGTPVTAPDASGATPDPSGAAPEPPDTAPADPPEAAPAEPPTQVLRRGRVSRLLDRLPHRSAPAEPPTQVLRRGRVNRVLDRLPHRSAPAAAAAAARAAAYAAAPTTAGEQPTQPLVPLKRKPTVPVRNRGRLRRRLRYLRRLREIQRRDLGGLVFELARLGRNRDDLVGLKVGRLDAIERELHALEVRLADERQWDELREPGIGGTCVSCGELYGSADRFCATCGVPLIIPPPPPT